MSKHLTVQNEDGSTFQIPVVSIREKAKPIYDYFGLEVGDEALFEHASDYLTQIIEEQDTDLMLSTLWQNEINFIDLWDAISCISSEHKKVYIAMPSQSYQIDIPSPYEKWIKTYSQLFLEIIKETSEQDHEIQRLLIGEQLITELSMTIHGNRVIGELYDKRGVDFFLQYYFCGEVSADNTPSLFNFAESYIVKALKNINRSEEAEAVKHDIEQRRKGLLQIQQSYFSHNEQSEKFDLEIARLQGERFWYDYLSGEVWDLLDSKSRDDLLDAFITEILTRNKILYNWCSITLSLCKVIEREMALSLFVPWITVINEASFTPPVSSSRSKEKRINHRKVTFEIMKKHASYHDKPPTLGQLSFIARYWNDPVMDECTNLMREIRTNTEKLDVNYLDNIIDLYQILNQSTNSMNIVDLRNASAHPGREQDIDWDKHVIGLKQSIGKPPKRILKLLTLYLRPDVLKAKNIVI